jgi:hypothetical protein
MSSTSPVRFVVWLVLFVAGVIVGFWYYAMNGGKLFAAPEKKRRKEEKTVPLQTRVEGETTRVLDQERYVNIKWLSFDQSNLQSVCKASEIIRKKDKILLKDPILYDYDYKTGVVTRTSGQFGEAVLKDGVVRELDTVRIWGKAMIFRYTVRKDELPEAFGMKAKKEPEPSVEIPGIQ